MEAQPCRLLPMVSMSSPSSARQRPGFTLEQPFYTHPRDIRPGLSSGSSRASGSSPTTSRVSRTPATISSTRSAGESIRRAARRGRRSARVLQRLPAPRLAGVHRARRPCRAARLPVPCLELRTRRTLHPGARHCRPASTPSSMGCIPAGCGCSTGSSTSASPGTTPRTSTSSRSTSMPYIAPHRITSRRQDRPPRDLPHRCELEAGWCGELPRSAPTASPAHPEYTATYAYVRACEHGGPRGYDEATRHLGRKDQGVGDAGRAGALGKTPFPISPTTAAVARSGTGVARSPPTADPRRR